LPELVKKYIFPALFYTPELQNRIKEDQKSKKKRKKRTSTLKEPSVGLMASPGYLNVLQSGLRGDM
jgi:hypothetical protein